MLRCCCLLVCLLQAQAQALLPIDHPRAERIGSLLSAIEAGQVAQLRDADPRWWPLPVGVGDELGNQVTHWTFRLQALIEALPPAQSAQARAALDDLARRMPATERHYFLPAASAVVSLADLADRHFDHGRFADFIRCVDVLPVAARAPFAARLQVAERFLRPAVAADFQPGGLVPVSRPIRFDDDGHHLRWERDGARLLGLDAQHRVRLQRLFGNVVEMRWQGDLALVVEAERWYCLDADGRVWSQERRDEQQVLGVAGGRLWLREGATVRGLDRAGAVRIDLPEAVFAAPLCWDDRSLWLGRDRLLLYQGSSLVATWQHRLSDPRSWRWRSVDERLLLQHHDGRLLRCRAFDQTSHDPEDRVLTLLRADRSREAWACWASLPPGPARDRLCLELTVIAPDLAVPLPAGGDPVLRLQALARRHLLGEEAHSGELATLAAAHPTVLIPGDERPQLDPARWDRIWSAAYLGLRLDGLGQERGGELQLARDADGHFAYRWGERWLHVQQDARFTTLSCSSDGLVLWRCRWEAPATLPSRSLRLQDGWLLLLEGQQRLHLVDPVLGRRDGSLHLPSHLALPSQMHVRDPQHIAIRHPIGVNTRISILDHQGVVTSIALDRPAVSASWRAGQVWATDASGRDWPVWPAAE